MNLLSSKPNPFDQNSEELAQLFAPHAAIALVDAVKRAPDLATGERHELTADQAFRLLVQASQQRHRKLHEIAEELATTGELRSGPPR